GGWIAHRYPKLDRRGLAAGVSLGVPSLHCAEPGECGALSAAGSAGGSKRRAATRSPGGKQHHTGDEETGTADLAAVRPGFCRRRIFGGCAAGLLVLRALRRE